MPIDRIEFARRIKEKYPQYQNVDDIKLANAVLDKYPQYQAIVGAETLGKTTREKEVRSILSDIAPEFFKAGVNQSITGLAFQLATGAEPLRLDDYDPNLLEHIGSTVVSFLMPLDIATVIAGGGIGGVAAKKAGGLAFRKLVQAGVSKNIAKEVAQTGVKRALAGGGALGLYNTVSSSVGQLARTGEVDLGEATKAGLKGTALGVLAGGVGGAVSIAGGKAIPQALSEAATFGTVAPLLEGEKPSPESYAQALGVVAGLRIVGAGAEKLLAKPEKIPAKDIERVIETKGEAPGVEPSSVLNANVAKRAENIEDFYTNQRQAVRDANKLTKSKLFDTLRRSIWDVAGFSKEKIREIGGPEGHRTIDALEGISGATAWGSIVAKRAADRIYRDIKGARMNNDFDNMIQSLRTIEIETKTNPRRAAARESYAERAITTPAKTLGAFVRFEPGKKAFRLIEVGERQFKYVGRGGKTITKDFPETLWHVKRPTTLEDSYAHIEKLQKTNPKYPVLERAGFEYFQAFRNLLRERLEARLITDVQYEQLAEFIFYSPSKFLSHLDPASPVWSSKKISVGESGIEHLRGGSEGYLVNDSQFLLTQAYIRSYGRIARNKANIALLEFARENPDASFIKEVPEGTKTPTGKQKISAIEQGVKQEMLVDNKFAESWLVRDPEISHSMSKLLRIGSGSFILRPFATGFMNPFFAITNFFRDAALIWMSTAEYSKYLPVAIGQFVKDLKVVRSDAWNKSGRWNDFGKEGGFMPFMTHQGRPFREVTGRFASANRAQWEGIREYMEWVGIFSESVTRLALRERAIKNRLSAEPKASPDRVKEIHQEATIIAKRYLDFSQGGSIVKAMDNALPYFSPQVQATRSIFRAIGTDPKLFTAKAAQVMGLSVALYLANREVNKDAYDEVPDRMKASNWIITTPVSWKDKDGQRRWLYFSIPKDQGQRVFASIAEAAAARLSTGELPHKQVIQSIEDFIPYRLWEKLPPTLSALLGAAQNRDFWMKEEIWRGPEVHPSEEYTLETPPQYVGAGEITGLSPERMRYMFGEVFTRRNIYTDMLGAGIKPILGGMTDKEERALADKIRLAPGIRRVVRATHPRSKLQGELERITKDENSRRIRQNRELQVLIRKDIKDARKWVRSQPREDRQRLFTRINRIRGREGLPFWWFDLTELPPEARATAFFALWSRAEDIERQKLLRTARRVPGMSSARFWRSFNQLRRGLKNI